MPVTTTQEMPFTQTDPPPSSMNLWRSVLLGLLGMVVVAGAFWLFREKLWNGSPVVVIEAGVTDDEILMGMSGALAGPTQALGKGMKTGIEAWFREVNERGGIHGRRLRLIALDDNYDPEPCLRNMKELTE